LMRMNSEINIDNILSSVLVPTLVLHRTEDPAISIQAGRFLATHIARAKLIELDGPDHIYWVGDNALQIADMIVDFVSGTEARSAAESRRMLATLMFTDIVGSTTRASELGDKAWHELLQAHDATIRREIARFRRNEVKSLGDGFLISSMARGARSGVLKRSWKR
jgi:Adenylate and Guanylate cyclase catalytic domain